MSSEELAEILRIARENNAAHDISGMLVYHGGSFLQVLEGPEGAVNSLYREDRERPETR